jgi:hypothetical protein
MFDLDRLVGELDEGADEARRVGRRLLLSDGRQGCDGRQGVGGVRPVVVRLGAAYSPPASVPPGLEVHVIAYRRGHRHA